MNTLKTVYIATIITGLFTGLFLSSSASAQDISGTWHGKLTVPTGSLTIVFHINQAAQGTYVTTLDSPDQGANGIKTQATSFSDSILTIQIPVIHASYKGKLKSDKTITGTFTQGMPIPLNLEKGEASRPKRPQEPQPPFPYKSEEVTVRNEQDGINLAGTLTLPEKGNKFPAVVLVTGSGAQNRDEEIMGHKPFLVIADYLTRNGIAVLRCDDRGTAASQGNHATATNEDFATDTEAAINYLRGRKEINTKKIGIIGHSAGGIIAFIVAAKDPAIAFIVSLAGAGVRGDSLMLKQVEMISKSQGMPDAFWQGTKPSIRNRYAILQQADKTTDELQKELYADVTKTMSSEQLKDLNTVQQISAQICSIAGYGFEIYHDKGKDTLMSILLLAMMLPFVAIMIPLFKMFTSWGLVNTWIALALPTISTPFMIMLFRQAARSFPHDIIEAARLEGLNEFQIFFKMFIPVMKSTYGAAMTVTFMSAWNNYLWPTIILQDSKAITMPMLVANLKSGYSVDYGMLMLGVLICTLPTAIIFLCLQKSFANGITGAVK